jgi:hypothetical protein
LMDLLMEYIVFTLFSGIKTYKWAFLFVFVLYFHCVQTGNGNRGKGFAYV